MFVHQCDKRITYGETDQMGYLYYGNYPQLYEIGRAEAIRSLGISYKVMESELKIMMPVMHVESRYRAPVYYDELIIIRTIIKVLPSKLIHFYHEILNESGKLIHKGEVKLFFIDIESGRRVSSPPYLNDKLLQFFD